MMCSLPFVSSPVWYLSYSSESAENCLTLEIFNKRNQHFGDLKFFFICDGPSIPKKYQKYSEHNLTTVEKVIYTCNIHLHLLPGFTGYDYLNICTCFFSLQLRSKNDIHFLQMS